MMMGPNNAPVNWNPGPRPPGLGGEFNIYQVLKNGLLLRPRGQDVVKSPHSGNIRT